jgi:hypothetical protein
MWIRKMFHLFSNSINCEILGKDGMRFEKSFNFIQTNNDYSMENKHDLIDQTYFML